MSISHIRCVYICLCFYICMYVCVVCSSDFSGTCTTSCSKKGTLLYLISQLPVNDLSNVGSCKTSSNVSQPSVSAGEAESEGEVCFMCVCAGTCMYV